MLRRQVIGKFVKANIAPHFPEFCLYRNKDLVRVRRPLLHGICFEQSEWDDVFYATCFVHFLTDPKDYLALGFGERSRRQDRTESTWRIEPIESEAADLLAAFRMNPYSPFNLDATCGNVLRLSEHKSWDGGRIDFGLGTCAVFENDPGLTRMHFDAVKRTIGTPTTDWDRVLLDRVVTIESLLGDLSAAQLKLRQWVEESIHLLKLEKFA